ncbi:DUF3253 domain-containing protein [Leptolyngbya sp. PL-A3]|uniref:DUF3253 domain-containing protein n=1 Tax=Leptolyngbya sp. PL-A3 TaxID=2933911 RepID=UPI003296F294
MRQCILAKLQARGPNNTISPAEVAQDLVGERWRSLIERVRQIGIELANAGIIQVLQEGQVVDPRTARGSIRYGLKP